MSDKNPNGEDLISFIAATVETMRDQMATKSDVGRIGVQPGSQDDRNTWRYRAGADSS